MKIYLHMLKQWSGSCKPGMTIAFDESKGRRVIAAGFAEEVPAPKPPKKQVPVVETATAEPKAERAEVSPEISQPVVEKETVEPVEEKAKANSNNKQNKKK